jgi:hypothetical protein
VPAQRPAPAQVALPSVSLNGKLTVARALAEIRRQTGIAIRDERGEPDQEVTLALERVSFWEAVDALAAAARAKVVQAGATGTVSLQRLKPDDRPAPICYDGPFRTRIVRVSTSRDLDSTRAGCTVDLEVSWTPSLRPVLVETRAQQVRLRTSSNEDVPVPEEGSTLGDVDGRYSLTVELPLPGRPRKEMNLGLLEGRLRAVAPSKMLRFTFDADLQGLAEAAPGGAQRRLVQEEVVCRLARLVLARERWSVQVRLDYPAGNRSLGSFQASSLVVNNELRLRSKDGKRTLEPASYVIDQVSSSRALVTYHFTDRPGSRRGRASDWKLSYQAPARIIELPFRFSFRDVPLP